MALRLSSLKTRAALANAAALAAILGGTSLYGAFLHRAEEAELRRSFDVHAGAFAQLTYQELARAYEEDGAQSPRLAGLVRRYLELEPDFERIAILDADGRSLYASGPDRHPGLSAALAPLLRATIAAGRMRLLRGGDPLDPIEVVTPYPQPGPARLAVSYRHGATALRPGLERRHGTAIVLSVLSILLAALFAAWLASRITRPIEQLTRGALEIGEGHFDRRLAVHGQDEVQILARTFNQMADRLKENISQLEESNRRLAALNEELQQLDRTKSDLLANVSHELRTPLTAIKGYTDYILEGKLGPVGEKQEKGLIVIQRNLDRLARSINALLDFSTLEVGRVSLNLQPFALPMLAEQIHQTLRSEFERKRIGFVAELPGDLPAVIADRDKLAQVLENLLINALKFTPPGGTIRVSASRVEERDGPRVEVAVRDSGIGIPAAELGRIFTRFHQVDGSSTRRYGGVGLGLAIVKSILDAHGSAIVVDSIEGQGSVFRFQLPCYEREARASAALPGYP